MDKKELSVSEFDLKTHFIDYWDEVVRQWLENDADYSKFKDQAKEQSQIIKAINDLILMSWIYSPHIKCPFLTTSKKTKI